MVEAFGVAVGVLQIGGAAAKLPKELFDFASKTARADDEVKAIANDVVFTSGILENVCQILDSKAAVKIANERACEDAKRMIIQCGQVFLELQDIVDRSHRLEKSTREYLTLRGRLGWPFREKRIIWLQTRLETLKSGPTVLLQVLQLRQDLLNGDVQTSNLDKREELIAKMWRHQDESLKILSALESKLFGAHTEEERIESKAAAKTRAASVTATEC